MKERVSMESLPGQTRIPPAIVRGWNSFFFTPADSRPLALVRIAVGGLLVWNWICLGFDLHAFLGSHGWADAEAAGRMMLPGSWSIWYGVSDAGLGAVWAVGLGAMLLLMIGLATPFAAIISWVFLVSTMRRVPIVLFGFDNIIVTWTFYLSVTFACGQAYSCDAWISKRGHRRRVEATHQPPGPQGSIAANLGLRLIQLHLCMIYASAGLAKLQGAPWWDGTAIGMLLGNSEFRPFDLTFLADHPRLLEFATHATVGLELLYPILVWFRGWRPWILTAAALMHVGIAISMGLTEFSLAMIAGNLAFVPGGWIDQLRLGRMALPRIKSRKGIPC